MSSIARHFFATLALSLLATAFSGCGSGNKEGAVAPLVKVGDSKCIQCHSSVTEALTGESIVAQYERTSPHNSPGLGCESCHGSGAMHNGVGPIPFPQPDANRCATCHNGRTAPATNANTAFDTSNHVEGTPSHTAGLCIRCHTNEGAVLSNISGFTGDSVVLQNPAYGPPVVTIPLTGFQCETCHEHGGGLRGVKGRDAAGNLVLYDPAINRSTNQFDLCTSCHNMYNYNQTKVIYSGTAASSTLILGRVGTAHHHRHRLVQEDCLHP